LMNLLIISVDTVATSPGLSQVVGELISNS
jgi:hypothetical protein